MEKAEELRTRVAKELSETMGEDIGKQFYDFYEYDDAESVISGGKELLSVFLGPKQAEKKMKAILKKYD